MLKRTKVDEALTIADSVFAFLSQNPKYDQTSPEAFMELQALLRELLPCLSIIESLGGCDARQGGLYSLVAETITQIIAYDAAGAAVTATAAGPPLNSDEDSVVGADRPIVRSGADATTTSTITATSDSAPAKDVPSSPQERSAEVPLQETTSAVRWSDIHGCEEAILELQQATLLPRRFPHLFTGTRRRWQRVLLYGPPGTGKTLLASATAAEYGAPFLSLSSADLLSKWVGESEKQVRQAFRQAAALPACVIFLDEIDALCSARGGGSETEVSRRLKTEFLLHLQNLAPGVMVLAATNLPWEIDSAIRRRFDHAIYVPLPPPAARERLIRTELRGIPHCLAERDVSHLARRTAGYSSSDVVQLVSRAAMGPLRELLHCPALRVATPEEVAEHHLGVSRAARVSADGADDDGTASVLSSAATTECAQSTLRRRSSVTAPSSPLGAPRDLTARAKRRASPASSAASSTVPRHRKRIVLPTRAKAAAAASHDGDTVTAANRGSNDMGDVYYVPCPSTHPAALGHLSVSVVDTSRVIIPVVRLRDFEQALANTVPSVSAQEVARFAQWRQNTGGNI